MKSKHLAGQAGTGRAGELEELRARCDLLEREATEHRLATEALRLRAGGLQRMLDEISYPIFMIAADGRYRYVNIAFAAGIGKPRDEIIGATLWDLFPGEEADRRLATVKQVVEQGIPSLIEVRLPRADGDRYYVTTAKPFRRADGATIDVLCISHDVTDLKTAEADLRESEERLELALAGSGAGLWDVDLRDGRAVYGERWCAMLGYRIDEVGTDYRSWERLIHPDDRREVKARVDAHLAGATESYECEYRLRHKEGHWVWILARGKVVARDAEGKPLRATGTHLDISRQKHLKVEGGDLLKRIESLMRAAGEPPASGGGARLATPPPPRLSTRQRQVLELVATGCTSAEIAKRLRIEQATVITHRRDLMRRLDLHSVAELTRYAIEQGLVRR